MPPKMPHCLVQRHRAPVSPLSIGRPDSCGVSSSGARPCARRSATLRPAHRSIGAPAWAWLELLVRLLEDDEALPPQAVVSNAAASATSPHRNATGTAPRERRFIGLPPVGGGMIAAAAKVPLR